MIPQTKIEQALNEMYPNDELYPVVFNRGFRYGVRFAEAEMKPIIIEYGNWILANNPQYDDTFHSNSETFEKFIQERNNP